MNFSSYVFCYRYGINVAEMIEVEKLEKVAFILKTIAHPIRLAIVELLRQHEKLSVSEIASRAGVEQSLTSHHLNTMKEKGVLEAEREGKNIFYSIKVKEVVNVIMCIENCKAVQA